MDLASKDHVVVCGFIRNDDSDDTWCPLDDPKRNGICVYWRSATVEGEFDVEAEKDFESFEAASDYATDLASRRGKLEIFYD